MLLNDEKFKSYIQIDENYDKLDSNLKLFEMFWHSFDIVTKDIFVVLYFDVYHDHIMTLSKISSLGIFAVFTQTCTCAYIIHAPHMVRNKLVPLYAIIRTKMQ